MPPKASKRAAASVLTLFIVLIGLTLAGCHSENKAKTTGTGRVCPVCQMPTRSVPMADLTYTICVCPECKKVTTLDGATRAEVEAYVGGDIGDTVHVCDECGRIVEICSICRHR